MKLKGKITILIGRDSTTIKVEDDVSNTNFLEIKLTPDQLSSALSRLAYTDCDLKVNGLDKIGKKHENKTFEFEIPKGLAYSREAGTEQLRELAQSQLSDGWIAEGYFGSKNSFFEKDGKQYARCIIRRWI